LQNPESLTVSPDKFLISGVNGYNKLYLYDLKNKKMILN